MNNFFLHLMESYPGLQILLTIILVATGVEILLVLANRVFPEWATIATAICIITIGGVLIFIIREPQSVYVSGAAIGAAFTFITTKYTNKKKEMEEVDE